MSVSPCLRDLAVRPALTFVGLDNVGERRQLRLLWTVLGAAHERVGAVHEQAVHAVGHVGKIRYRVGRMAPRVVAFFAAVAMAHTPRETMLLTEPRARCLRMRCASGRRILTRLKTPKFAAVAAWAFVAPPTLRHALLKARVKTGWGAPA